MVPAVMELELVVIDELETHAVPDDVYAVADGEVAKVVERAAAPVEVEVQEAKTIISEVEVVVTAVVEASQSPINSDPVTKVA